MAEARGQFTVTDLLDGYGTRFIYRRAATQPATPTSNVFGTIDTGWHININDATGTDRLWVSSRATNGQSYAPGSSWSTPNEYQVEGPFTVSVYRQQATSLAAPSRPTGGVYNRFTRAFTTVPTGWVDTLPTSASGQTIYQSNATINPLTDNTTSTSLTGRWSVPFTVGAMGPSGPPGDPGARGPAGLRVFESNFYSISASTTRPSFSTVGLAYNFTTSLFTGIPSGWSVTPRTFTGNEPAGATYWTQRVTVREVSGSTQGVVTALGSPTGAAVFPVDIQSDNFVAGVSGFRLQRDTGNAQINNLEIRGDIESTNYRDPGLINVNNRQRWNGGGVLFDNEWAIRDSNNFNVNYSSWSDWSNNVLIIDDSEEVLTGQNVPREAPGRTITISFPDTSQTQALSPGVIASAEFEVQSVALSNNNTDFRFTLGPVQNPQGTPPIGSVSRADFQIPGGEGAITGQGYFLDSSAGTIRANNFIAEGPNNTIQGANLIGNRITGATLIESPVIRGGTVEGGVIVGATILATGSTAQATNPQRSSGGFLAATPQSRNFQQRSISLSGTGRVSRPRGRVLEQLGNTSTVSFPQSATNLHTHYDRTPYGPYNQTTLNRSYSPWKWVEFTLNNFSNIEGGGYPQFGFRFLINGTIRAQFIYDQRRSSFVSRGTVSGEQRYFTTETDEEGGSRRVFGGYNYSLLNSSTYGYLYATHVANWRTPRSNQMRCWGLLNLDGNDTIGFRWDNWNYDRQHPNGSWGTVDITTYNYAPSATDAQWTTLTSFTGANSLPSNSIRPPGT